MRREVGRGSRMKEKEKAWKEKRESWEESKGIKGWELRWKKKRSQKQTRGE